MESCIIKLVWTADKLIDEKTRLIEGVCDWIDVEIQIYRTIVSGYNQLILFEVVR